MQFRLRFLVPGIRARQRSTQVLVCCVAWLFIATTRAQTPEHQHPVVPKQPQPAGSTPASGQTAAASAGHQMNHQTMSHEMKTSFGPVDDRQEASGTAWQPEATPMHAHHSMLGDWQLMTHYNAFLG